VDSELEVPVDSVPSKVVSVGKVVSEPLVSELFHIEGVLLEIAAEYLLHLISILEGKLFKGD
jgi:hypothetical protein